MTYVRSDKLLDGVTADTQSGILALADYDDPTIEVEGLNGTDDVLQILASNKNFNEAVVFGDLQQIGSDITADGIYAVEPGAMWVGVDLNLVSGSGPVTVRLAGRASG